MIKIRRLVSLGVTTAVLGALQPVMALENGLARTPPMGWNSWNIFGLEPTEPRIKQIADAIVASGMKDAGYQYVVIDDGWGTKPRDANGNILPDPAKFPNGIKPVADYVHSLGLKFGIYGDIGTLTCGWTQPGSYGYEYQDAMLFASWDVDYLKHDVCNMVQGQDGRASYELMGWALLATGRPIVYSICDWTGSLQSWTWGADVGNLWRTIWDVHNNWRSITDAIDANADLYIYAKPGAWNDPDMLQVGNQGLTLSEYRVQFGMWCIMAAPLMAGNDLRTMSTQVRDILCAPELIAVDQDPLGWQGIRRRDLGDQEVWVKRMQDDSYAVALLNRGGSSVNITLNWSDLWQLAGTSAAVRDLWSRQDLGVYTNSLSRPVGSHDVAMLRVRSILTRREFAASRDTWMDYLRPNDNNATDWVGILGGDGTNPIVGRFLLHYDLSSVSTAAVVRAAVLRLGFQSVNNGPNACSVYRIAPGKADWTDAASWNNYKSGSPWTQAGCSSPGNDYVPTPIGTFQTPGSNQGGYVDVLLDTATVRSWFGRDNQNTGMLIRMTNEIAWTNCRVYLSEEPKWDMRPTLILYFENNGSEPPVNQPPAVSVTSPLNNSVHVAPANIVLAATVTDPDSSVTSVSFYRGTTLLVTDMTSPYEYTWTNVSSGTYWLQALAQDNRGAVNLSAAVNISVVPSGTPVNQPPVVTLTSPVSGSTYTAPATVPLVATASDSDGTIARVEFWTGSTLLNADTASPYAYSWAGVAAGSYPLRAVAYDNQNATSTSPVVNITVYSSGTPSNQPPTVSLTSPVSGSSYTAPANITLAATASDSDGSIAAVRFYQGMTMLTLDTASPYTYTWTGVSSGTYQLYATATDNQGAVSTSAVASVTVYPPNQPPVVSLTSPVNNSTYTAPANITLAATATDPDGSVASVRFYRGSTLLATDTASPYEYTWINVSSGTYQLRAVAQDNQGATSTSTVVTVTVLSSSTPAVWYTLTATANPANGGTVTPASGTYLAGSQIQVTATPNADYTFATWSGDASGTNPTVTLTMDSNKSITANFTYVPPANSSPTVSITSPQDGATFTAPASITITATATDSDGSIAAVRFYSGTTQLGVDSTSPYSFTWTGVGAGSYFLTAQAEDNQGAVGTSAVVGITVNAQPVYYTLTVSANPATGGTVALNPPPSGSGYLAGTQVAVTATPNAGYVFTGWSGNASGTNPTITLMMDGDKTVTAQFTPVTSNVTLTVTANPANAGTIALNPPGGSYVPGTAVTVTATPSQGYVFSGWSGGVVSTANPLNVTVTANMNLVANFITAPSTGTTPDVQPGTVRIVGGLDGYVNTAYENSVSVFFQPRRAGTVYIRVYSLNGRLVREGVVMSAMPGTVSSFSWDLRNNDGTAVSAGVYIVYVKGGGLEIKKKIVVLH